MGRGIKGTVVMKDPDLKVVFTGSTSWQQVDILHANTPTRTDALPLIHTDRLQLFQQTWEVTRVTVHSLGAGNTKMKKNKRLDAFFYFLFYGWCDV